MDNILNSSGQEDTQNVFIEDYLPEGIIKVYPYVAWRMKGDKVSFENEAISAIAISQEKLVENGFTNCETDENGRFFIPCIGARVKNSRIEQGSPSSSFANQLKYFDEMTMLTNNLKGAKQMNIVFVTIDEPFNNEKYLSGDQKVFLMGQIVSANLTNFDNSEDLPNTFEENTTSQFQLTSSNVIANQFSNSNIIFDTNANENEVFEVDYNGKKVGGLKIAFDKFSLINEIIGNGKINGNLGHVNFKILENITPIKTSPISIRDNKLSLYFDWWNYDFALSMFVANFFNKPNGLLMNDLKTIGVFTNNEVDMLKGLIVATFGASTNWSGFKRIESGSDFGKLALNQRIWLLDVKSFEGKTASEIGNMFIDFYENLYSIDAKRSDYKFVKSVINSISRYIASKYSTAKGLNNFHETLLPWFFEPMTNIELGSREENKLGGGTETVWYLKNDIAFKLKSNFFKLENSQILLKDEVLISGSQILTTIDRKIALPSLDYPIIEINKSTIAGDINANSNNDLKYNFYIPNSDLEIVKKLYLNLKELVLQQEQKTITLNSESFDLGRGQLEINQEIARDLPVFIKNDFAKKYPSIKIEDIEVVSQGVIEFGWTDWEHVIVTNPSWGGGVTEQLAKDYLIFRSNFAYTREGIEIQNLKEYNTTDQGYKVEFDFRLRKHFVKNYEVVYTQKTQSIGINRETVFEKLDYIKLLNDLGVGGYQTLTLFEKNGLNIEELNELTISQVWGNEIKIIYKSYELKIPLLNKKDETIGIQKILFT